MLGDVIASSFQKINYLSILKKSISYRNKKENNDLFINLLSKEVLFTEKNNNVQMDNYNIVLENDEVDNNIENEITSDEYLNDTVENELIEASKVSELNTTVVKENNLSESYNVSYNSVKIKNETNFELTQDILTPNIEFSDKNNIIIFHTHTCESYTQTELNHYTVSRKL